MMLRKKTITNGAFWKVRLIIERVHRDCLEIQKSKCVSINQQMTQFSGSCSFCQYIPNKPNPVGIENLVMTSVRVRCMACNVFLCLQSNINCLQDPTHKLNKITELSILQILVISNH